ncbi:MAG: 3-dehydroquinate synthase [Candidatus Aureabacteria bacterium]|nr:3-dehydroquinate synthase [Candidatus Auribacterota bacterium]
MRAVRMRLGERSYDILIGRGLIAKAGRCLRGWGLDGSCLVVADRKVGRIYGAKLLSALKGSGFTAKLFSLPPGEEHKTLHETERIYRAMLEVGLDRASFIVSLGGGVAGDIAGFAAATYMRGIPFVQVPTTLLAQVDASVGGKVGVNLREGKNLIGAFHQPRGVLIDPSVLATLDRWQLSTGFAEVIKHAIIADARYFGFLEKNSARALSREPACMERIIMRSCEIKAGIVARDERESGLRMILNFGHTIGHAIETVTGYRLYLHGEAVAIGMACASAVAARLGYLSGGSHRRIIALLQKYGLPVRMEKIPVEKLLRAIPRDKKARGGKARFVLPERIGRVFVTEGVGEDIIRAVVKDMSRG